MRVWLDYLWDSLRDRLWFIPSLFSLMGLALAIISLTIDHHFDGEIEWLPWAFRTTGSAARTVLGSLIGGLVTVAGLVLSLTMLSVSQTASQYGPRLIRTVFDRSITQGTLGLFLGTIFFSMVVLRSIRDLSSGEELFTPNLSIMLAELAGAACLFSLLAFTNHVARCMRAETLIESIFEDLKSTADRLFPEPESGQSNATLQPQEQWVPIDPSLNVQARQVGYLQAIDLDSLLRLAVEHNLRIDIKCRPGDFVFSGQLLALVGESASSEVSHSISNGSQQGGTPTDDLLNLSEEVDESDDRMNQIRRSFLIGLVRTPRQDIEAGLMELVEAGVRALSPGVNDPTTAINCIDYLASILRELTCRTWPSSVLADKHNQPRLHAPRHSFAEVLGTAFNQMRQNAVGSIAVQCRLLEGLHAIAKVAVNVEHRSAIKQQAVMILRQAERNIEEPHDLDDIRSRFDRVLTALQE